MTSLKKSATSHDCRYGNSQWQPSRPIHHPSGGIKIIIQSLAVQPSTAGTTKMPFEALIQRANDSASFDTSLEFKSLPPNRQAKATKSRTAAAKQFHNNTIHGFGYMDELRERLNRNVAADAIDLPSKKIPFFDKKNVIETTPKGTGQKLANSANVTGKRLPTCSTPFRPKRPSQLNLQTPPADARFIDSENESIDDVVEGDAALMDVSTTAVESADEDDAQNHTLIKCFSLTPDSCRRLASNRSVISAPNSPKCERRSHFLSSFRKNRSSIVSPLEESPLRRQRNVKIKNSKFFNFFRSTPVATKSSSTDSANLSETCTRLRQLLANAEDLDDTELGCAPLLVQENVDRHSAEKTIDWGENFEFSFICEPSHSDVEMEDGDGIEDDQKSIYVSCESVSTEQMLQSIPMVKVTPATASAASTHLIRPSAPNSLSPFRRSVSDPTLRGLVFTTVGDIRPTEPNAMAATQIQMHAIRVSTQLSHDR